MAAATKRVYYIGKGTEIEASEDGGKTWQTFTRCKLMDYNGTPYVWAPPGTAWAMKRLCTKHPFLRHVVSGEPMLERNRSIPVVIGPGPSDSFLDLDLDERKHAFLSRNAEGLVSEEQYEATLSPEVLREKAERLLKEAAKREPKKATTTSAKAKATEE